MQKLVPLRASIGYWEGVKEWGKGRNVLVENLGNIKFLKKKSVEKGSCVYFLKLVWSQKHSF